MVAISLFAFARGVVPYPSVTADKLLAAAFFGSLGAVIRFTIRGCAVIDRTDILAIFMSCKQSLSASEFILVFSAASLFAFSGSCNVRHAFLPGSVQNY